MTASMRDGEIEFVVIESQLGGKCRVRNPWGDEQSVAVFRDESKAEGVNGSLLTFKTREGERITLLRAGTTPEQVQAIVA